jgi:hypothetical protein
MAHRKKELQVILASNGFYPQAFEWRGRTVRVQVVRNVATYGTQRRYLVQTAEGCFELALDRNTGAWQMRHSPNWLDRLWARWQNAPRYPLPARRRRANQFATTRVQ